MYPASSIQRRMSWIKASSRRAIDRFNNLMNQVMQTWTPEQKKMWQRDVGICGASFMSISEWSENDGDSTTREEMLQAELDRLTNAVRKHRDAKGHDRCWENDLELYAHLYDIIPGKLSPELPPECEFQQKCKEYYYQQMSLKGKPIEPSKGDWFPKEG